MYYIKNCWSKVTKADSEIKLKFMEAPGDRLHEQKECYKAQVRYHASRLNVTTFKSDIRQVDRCHYFQERYTSGWNIIKSKKKKFYQYMNIFQLKKIP